MRDVTQAGAGRRRRAQNASDACEGRTDDRSWRSRQINGAAYDHYGYTFNTPHNCSTIRGSRCRDPNFASAAGVSAENACPVACGSCDCAPHCSPANDTTSAAVVTGALVEYEVQSTVDVSAAFAPEGFVERYVAAVDAVNGSALPELSATDVSAEPAAVVTNVSFTVRLPEDNTDALGGMVAILASDANSIAAAVVGGGPCSPDLDPCQNGGVCLLDENSTHGVACNCTELFNGALCETAEWVPPPGVVGGTLTLGGTVVAAVFVAGTPERALFERGFVADVATRLSVESGRVTVRDVTPGSVVVDFSVAADSSGVPLSAGVLLVAFGEPVTLPTLGMSTIEAVSGVKMTPIARADDADDSADDIRAPGTDTTSPFFFVWVAIVVVLGLGAVCAVGLCIVFRRRAEKASGPDAYDMAVAALEASLEEGMTVEEMEERRAERKEQRHAEELVHREENAREKSRKKHGSFVTGKPAKVSEMAARESQQKLSAVKERQTKLAGGDKKKKKKKKPKPTRVSASSRTGKTGLAAAIDDEDLKAAFNGRETKKTTKQSDRRLKQQRSKKDASSERRKKQKERRAAEEVDDAVGGAREALEQARQMERGLFDDEPGERSLDSPLRNLPGSVNTQEPPEPPAEKEKEKKKKKRRRASVAESGVQAAEPEPEPEPKPKVDPRRRRASVNVDELKARQKERQRDKEKAQQTQPEKEKLKPKSRRRRVSVQDAVVVDLQLVKQDAGGGASPVNLDGRKKSDSVIMKRRRRRASVEI